MAKPLVLELQADCLDSSVSILDVLRKALVVARKLSLADDEVWIDKELNGYKKGDEPPTYRLLKGQTRAHHPYQGWIPALFKDSEQSDFVSTCFAGQAIGELEDLIKHGKGEFEFPFDDDAQRALIRGSRGRLRYSRFLTRAAISGILDAVRNMVLRWCLQLEKEGILGEGMTFNAKEKEAAAQASHIINFNAPVSHSQVQQGTNRSTQSMSVGLDGKAISEFIGLVTAQLEELKLASGDRAQLQAEVQTLQSQLSAPRPNDSIIRESLRSIRNILEGCVGSLLASGLINEVGKLLP